MKLSIWHNIRWSRYKGVVFSALYRQCQDRGIEVKFYQIAETELRRAALSPVDLSWHNYPHKLVFEAAYSDIPKVRAGWLLAKQAWKDAADLTILTGYERPEVWLQVLALRFRGKKFAFFSDSTIWDKPQSFIKGIAKRIVFGLSSGVFCYGERAAQYVEHYGVPSHKIFIRRQAAALPQGYSRSAALARRLQSAPSPEAPRYLYVGRLSAEKSLEKLLMAFQQVLTDSARAELVVVGGGPEADNLKALAVQLGINSHVHFAGAKFGEELLDEYLAATCLVLPSYSEPWGLVVNESLSYGCPAIVSNRCGCVPELITDGKTGYVYDWSCAADLAEKLLLAPQAFQDIAAIAEACLDRISTFTPENAARGILDGAVMIAGPEAARPSSRPSSKTVGS